MRILVLSDIHANLEALETCLAAAPPFDRVFNLGDLVGYGANPGEVIDRSREIGTVFVRGNHDKACAGVSSLEDFNPIAALAVRWTQKQLTPEHMEFLRALPKGPIEPEPGIQCVHGSVSDEDHYLLNGYEAFKILESTEIPITVFGHTHVQGGFRGDPANDNWGTITPDYRTRPRAEEHTLKLLKGVRYLLNPGSVGQPRDGDPRAAFALVDTDAAIFTFHRIPYDIAAAQKKIRDAGLPDRLAARLAEGH